MEYKNVRPMIKKLGIKGDPVTVSTATSYKNSQPNSSQNNDIEEISQSTIILDETKTNTSTTGNENIENIKPTLSTQKTQNNEYTEEDDFSYRVGDVAKSIDKVEKLPKSTKRVVGDSIPTDVQNMDQWNRSDAEDSYNGILSSVKELKSLTQFDKSRETPAHTPEKIEHYQPLNPNAEKLVKFIEGNDHSTISFQPNTEPIQSKVDRLNIIKNLEKQQEMKSKNSSSYAEVRPLPFSEVDLRSFFSQDELQKPLSPLNPVPFKSMDLRKSNEDDQTEFWEINHSQQMSTSLKNNVPTQNTRAKVVAPTPSNIDTLSQDDFSLKELDLKDEDLYGEIVEQETVEQEEKKNFVSKDSKEVSRFAWLAYILFFIPLLINSKSAYVRHSANEGLEINFVDVLGIICILVGKFVQPSTLIAEGVLIGLMILGSILLVLTTITKLFMIVATLKGKYVSTPWFWNIEIIR